MPLVLALGLRSLGSQVGSSCSILLLKVSKTFTFENFGNASFTVSGTPQDGDTFTLSNNGSGSGDNRNALLLGAFQSDGSLLNSTANYQEVFAGTVGEVGIQKDKLKRH